MHKETITFRLDEQKRKAIDVIAAGLDRDRTYILNEAIDTYLEVHQWQMNHVKKGIRQANAGEFASDSQVKAILTKWQK